MINTIFTLLAERGIRLWLNNDDLNYKAPKGALTDSLKTLIVQHKADLIQFLKQQHDDGSRGYLPVGRRGVNSTHPLSFGQQRLWLLDRMNNGSAHYNMPCALRLTGKLDIDALGHAFTRILERHESLRTCFVADSDDEPRQVLMPAMAFQVHQRDLCSVAVKRPPLPMRCSGIVWVRCWLSSWFMSFGIWGAPNPWLCSFPVRRHQPGARTTTQTRGVSRAAIVN